MAASTTTYDHWKLASGESREPTPRDSFREAIEQLEKKLRVRRESEAHAYEVQSEDCRAKFEILLEDVEVDCQHPEDLPEAFSKAVRAAVERAIARIRI
jgi:hypothetical protein